jgi:hypothetical protein
VPGGVAAWERIPEGIPHVFSPRIEILFMNYVFLWPNSALYGDLSTQHENNLQKVR